jgi:hypothetical protein
LTDNIAVIWTRILAIETLSDWWWIPNRRWIS